MVFLEYDWAMETWMWRMLSCCSFGVCVQWQVEVLCGASLVLAVLCGTPTPFCVTLKLFALALLVCEFEDRRALSKNRKHKHTYTRGLGVYM